MEVGGRYITDAAPGGGVASVEVAGANAPKESEMSDEAVARTLESATYELPGA